MLVESFFACGDESLIVSGMNTISPKLSLIEKINIATIDAKSVVPESGSVRAMLIGNPTTIRTSGILRRKNDRPWMEARSFSSIGRKLGFENTIQKISRV